MRYATWLGAETPCPVTDNDRVAVMTRLHGWEAEPEALRYEGPVTACQVGELAGCVAVPMSAREWRVWHPDRAAFVSEDGGQVWRVARWRGSVDAEMVASPTDMLEWLRAALDGASQSLVGTSHGYVLAINRFVPTLWAALREDASAFEQDEAPARLAYAHTATIEGAVAEALHELVTRAHLSREEHATVAQLCERWAELR